MVAVVTAGTGGHHQPAAVSAGKGFFAGMGFVITLFVLFSLVFTIHNGNPRSNYFVSGYIIAKIGDMSMLQ
jgi:hypothetical protein